MTCHRCGAPASWRAPSPITGREQGWYRHMIDTPKGPRCHDANSCKNRAAAADLQLFTP